MTTKLKNSLSVITLFVFFIMAVASSGVKHMTFTEAGGQIPPGFSQSRDTLLVLEEGNGSYRRFLRNSFKENYFGPYKTISSPDLPQFPVEQYPYVFDHDIISKMRYSATGGSSNTAAYDIFWITDRKTSKKYQTKGSAYYAKLMRAYVKALEVARGK